MKNKITIVLLVVGCLFAFLSVGVFMENKEAVLHSSYHPHARQLFALEQIMFLVGGIIATIFILGAGVAVISFTILTLILAGWSLWEDGDEIVRCWLWLGAATLVGYVGYKVVKKVANEVSEALPASAKTALAVGAASAIALPPVIKAIKTAKDDASRRSQ